MPRPKTPSTPKASSALLEAMRHLRPSGDKSFEELVARLLSRLSGERIRRCKAGAQGGVDALGEIPFAIEDKRHAREVRSRDLLGGLTSAAGTYSDLQLWLLVATCAVSAQDREEVVDAGLRQGIEVLVLDATASDPDLPGVGSLAALAATDVQITVDVLGNPAWSTGRKTFDLDAIRQELSTIRALPNYGAWEDRLRRELTDLPTWQHLIRSQNQRLRSLILGDAANAFGTRYDPEDAVPRTAEKDLVTWWQECKSSETCKVAVVTGDRYDGKTWLVYRWLSATLDRFDVPVFLFSSSHVKQAHGDLDALILHEAERALGRFGSHARDVLARHKSRRKGNGPWCLVLLDGANEYVGAPEALAAAILSTVPTIQPLTPSRDVRRAGLVDRNEAPPSDDIRRCGLLLTCRARDYDPSWFGSRDVQRIELGQYDEDEFRTALAHRGLQPQQLAHLPPSALEMVHRPRFLDLMLRHQNDLGGFGVVTADVLYYLDASDKVSTWESGAVRGNPVAFKALLARLASAWMQSGRLTHSSVWRELTGVTERIEQSLHTLTSEGVLMPQGDGTFVPDMDRLALGMGLFIRERLLELRDDTQMGQTLADMFEPHSEDDEKVRWLRSAVTVSVLAGDITAHPTLVQALIAAWLSARNFAQADLHDLRVLAPHLLTPVLQMLSSGQLCNDNVLLFVEPIIAAGLDADAPAVERAVRRWCRLVPIGFRRYIGDKGGEPAAVAQRMAESSLNDLDLTPSNGIEADTVAAYQRLALFLAATQPSLLRPIDLLALLASRHSAGGDLSHGERYAIRRLLAHTDAAWFEEQVRTWAGQPTSRALVLREMIVATDRNNLQELLARLPELEAWTWSWEALTATELAALQPTQDQEEILKVAKRARLLALDPSSPPPPRRWRTALRAAAAARFGALNTLHAYNSTSRDDLDMKQLEPALAAWAPAGAARIWRRFIGDIPRRLAANEQSWSWALEEHAVLLTSARRRMLLDLVRGALHGDADRNHALELAYRTVLAGSSAADRLRLILSHPFEQEWVSLYEIAAAGMDDALRRRALTAFRTERDPRRLIRAEYLLGYLRAKLSTSDVARLVPSVVTIGPRQDADNAARFLLRNARVDDATPPDSLGAFIEVAQSPAEAAWQYVAFLDRRRRPGARTAEWLARALAAPETARRRGAASDMPDDVAVAEGIALLAVEVRDSLRRAMERPALGESDQFPDSILGEISDAAFEEWVRLLLALPTYVCRSHVGLLIAVVRHGLRTRHAAARELWTLAYPFQRDRFGWHTRIVVEGRLDWTLATIHDPALDDDLATEILRDLIRDCRSNTELVSVALGARLESTARLSNVIDGDLQSADATDRARARFIAGWMPENEILRERIAAPDPSRWVERLGQRAMGRLDRERWAREWLRRFIAEKRRTARWAAGHLFLACADAATPFWADDVLYHEHTAVPAARRGEAMLLLSKIRAKPDDSDLRDNFLGYPVRELAQVVPPWRVTKRWEDVEA